MPSLPSLGNIMPRLPSLGGSAGRIIPSVEESWESLPRSRQLEVLGAPEVDIEAARAYERLHGPTGIATIVGARGAQGDPFFRTEEPQPRRGLLEILTDFATRPQSAVTGFVTGLAGAERLRQTRDAQGISDGTLFDQPERVEGGLDLAMERFRQGWSGEEKFQAADFGVLAYDRHTAGTGERFMKSAAGFVLDVAIDPITYLSFGGSILGRRAAAVAVNEQARRNTYRIAQSLDEDGLLRAVRDGVARAGTDESVLSRNLEAAFRTNWEQAGLAPGQILSLEDMGRLFGNNRAALLEAATDSIAYTAAAMYRSFGAGGTRRYLASYGDVGKQVWRALPGDLRGGLRIRVPFSGLVRRGVTGGPSPLVVRLSPFEPGVVGDALQLSSASNGFRNWMRTRTLMRQAGNELSGATGATDRRTAIEIFNRGKEQGYRLFGKRDLKVDPKGRAVSWANSQILEQGLAENRRGIYGWASELLGPLKSGQSSYALGRSINAAEYDELFDRAIRGHLADVQGGTVSIEDLFGIAGRKATEVEQHAYEAAYNFQQAIRQVEMRLSQLESEMSGFRGRFLENYWPRVVDDMQQELAAKGFSSGGFANLKTRSHFVAEYNADGSVKRWMTPSEIAQTLGSPLFMEQADVAMSSYLVSMVRFMEEERFFQFLLDRGALIKGGADTFRVRNDITGAAGRFVQAFNEATGRRETLRLLGVDGAESLTARTGIRGAELDMLVDQARRAGEAVHAGRVHGPAILGDYADRTGRGVLASTDGVSLVPQPGGTYLVTRGSGPDLEYLTPAGRWSKKVPKNSFEDLAQARQAADTVMINPRKLEFIERQKAIVDDFYTKYTRLLKAVDEDTMDFIGPLAGAGRDGAPVNPLNPANIPYADQDFYFDAMLQSIRDFGSDAGLQPRQLIADAYKSGRWGAGAGQPIVPVGTNNGPRMRQFWADRMEELNLFGAETVVEDVQRFFRAVEKPEGFKRWVNDYYRPFYALQKSLMTSQRGPGYVLRNIQGGMWNAYLMGTSGRHFKIAGAVKTAEYQARYRAERITKDPTKIGEVTRQEFVKILTDKFGAKRANQLTEWWELFEFRGLRGREVASKTRGDQAVASGTGELTGDISRLIPDADETFSQWLNRKGTSHLWARTMGEAAQGSEDYLRFAAFLRGIDMYGTTDGGRAAALIVKGTQFDYADLSRFEAETVKMLVPFYTWTRNNVPLQMRAIIAEPGKIMKAIRLNDALGDAFGDPDDPEEPLPAYVRERFGWRVRTDLMTGPSGDAVTAGMVFGEPLVDVNRLFGTPTQPGGTGLGTILNWREIANNMNPAITAGAPLVTAMELSTGGRLPREEEAPIWALPFARTTPEGDKVVNARALRAARQIVVPLGMAERYAPQLLGNERLQRRWYTSLGSAILGLPVSTLDPYQTSAELRQQEQRLRGRLVREMGEEYPTRVAYVRAVLEVGADPFEMQYIRNVLLDGRDVTDVPIEELDVYAMRDTINFLRRIERLRAAGVPESTIETMAAYFRPRTDLEMGVRAGGVQPLTAQQLQELGETPESVARMTDFERAELVMRYAEQNPGWRPRR